MISESSTCYILPETATSYECVWLPTYIAFNHSVYARGRGNNNSARMLCTPTDFNNDKASEGCTTINRWNWTKEKIEIGRKRCLKNANWNFCGVYYLQDTCARIQVRCRRREWDGRDKEQMLQVDEWSYVLFSMNRVKCIYMCMGIKYISAVSYTPTIVF